MELSYICGNNCIVGKDVSFGTNVTIGHNCIIEDGVIIGDNCYIDSNTIIRSGSRIGENSNIGSNCIIGEYGMDFYQNHNSPSSHLTIGSNALIRSGSIIYTNSEIGSCFQTGHRVTIREKSSIGHNVSVGTLCDIQGYCEIGDFVRLHSNVHIGQLSIVDSFVWIFPYVVLTNDATPPTENLAGVHVRPFAIIATGAIIMPGLEIGQDSLVGAGAIVTKPVDPYAVVVGNPAKCISDVRKIKNKVTGESVYPWRKHFSKYMPWTEMGFENWYLSLSTEEKEAYSISRLF